MLQSWALVLSAFHKVPVFQFFQFIQVPLDGSPAIIMLSFSLLFSSNYKSDQSCFLQANDKDVK